MLGRNEVELSAKNARVPCIITLPFTHAVSSKLCAPKRGISYFLFQLTVPTHFLMFLQ